MTTITPNDADLQRVDQAILTELTENAWVWGVRNPDDFLSDLGELIAGALGTAFSLDPDGLPDLVEVKDHRNPRTTTFTYDLRDVPSPWRAVVVLDEDSRVWVESVDPLDPVTNHTTPTPTPTPTDKENHQ